MKENKLGSTHIFMVHVFQHPQFSVGPLGVNGWLEGSGDLLDGHPEELAIGSLYWGVICWANLQCFDSIEFQNFLYGNFNHMMENWKTLTLCKNKENEKHSQLLQWHFIDFAKCDSLLLIFFTEYSISCYHVVHVDIPGHRLQTQCQQGSCTSPAPPRWPCGAPPCGRPPSCWQWWWWHSVGWGWQCLTLNTIFCHYSALSSSRPH